MFWFKIILLGNSGVGKTSLLSQYVTGALGPETMYTIGVEFKIKEIQVENWSEFLRFIVYSNVQVDGKDVRLALWDTAGLSIIFINPFTFCLMFNLIIIGQERFRSITKTYFRGVQGAVLVYDVTDRFNYHL